ncbi:MAG: hypothetical protein WCI89_02630 [bacterium]
MSLHAKHTLFFIFLIIAAAVLGLFLMRAPAPAANTDFGDLTRVYENTAEGFSIRYPEGYAVDSRYVYQEMGLEHLIEGVKFTISTSTAAGTNLGADSYLSVERIATTSACTAALFLDQSGGAQTPTHTLTENGTIYSVASTTGAGAGNRYEETVYALPNTNPCRAARYFIHYSVFENYPPGTVREFDKQALLFEFDHIRKTVDVLK